LSGWNRGIGAKVLIFTQYFLTRSAGFCCGGPARSSAQGQSRNDGLVIGCNPYPHSKPR
jgi:IMP dehydrogenase